MKIHPKSDQILKFVSNLTKKVTDKTIFSSQRAKASHNFALSDAQLKLKIHYKVTSAPTHTEL